MALNFALSSDTQIQVVITADESVNADDDTRRTYLDTGDASLLHITEGATWFTLKALSPAERLQAEINAGAHTRSELGRHLAEQRGEHTGEARARWHHALNDDEREAVASYDQYIEACYVETVKAGLVSIDGHDGDPFEVLQSIRPEGVRQLAIVELACHVQRISLLGPDEKK